MKVLVLGADGYLGWATCMHFSCKGHEVTAVDNYFRRNASERLGCPPLIPTPGLPQRAKTWKGMGGGAIRVLTGDITDYDFLLAVFGLCQPEVVIHYAEQPSAVYSMMDRDTAAFTVQNNLVGTLNLAYAVKETGSACHIIKLGTMGEYGTPDIDIEEGWLEIEHKGRKDRFLFPRQAGSIYHTSKIQDTDLLWFFARTWGLSVTDLMQGPVYGISTEEDNMYPDLMPNFSYDEVFGTVLNRFVVQAVAGHPLTVYGRGGQARGYINIKDTLQCVYLSSMLPPGPGELRVFNQMTETFTVNDLATKVRKAGEKLGYEVKIGHMENPRVEQEEHYYNPKYTGLMELGLKPHYLTDDVLEGMFRLVAGYKSRINRASIFRGVKWR
ncbi:MAG: NAD-dependent epimerase/dehydratase family protein [Nitrospiraceae bacterium]|nr:NAD-dependent epimerase/dehydratase family protein [Nitrospiraceae bacterium]